MLWSVLHHFTLFPNSRKAKLTKHRTVKLARCFYIKTESLLTGITHDLHNANDLSHTERNLALHVVNVAVFTDRLWNSALGTALASEEVFSEGSESGQQSSKSQRVRQISF